MHEQQAIETSTCNVWQENLYPLALAFAFLHDRLSVDIYYHEFKNKGVYINAFKRIARPCLM